MMIASFRAAMLAVVWAGMTACTPPAPAVDPVRSVKTITLGLANVNSEFEFSGEVRARVESRLGFRVAGKIVARRVELGQRVKAGQVLAEIDAGDYQLAVDAARAQARVAQTNFDLAQADFNRYKELFDKAFISGAELERKDATLKAAKAQLEQAQAQSQSQGNQVGYSKLLADRAGVVTAIEAEAGQVVAAGTPVLRLAEDGARDAVVSVPEDKLDMVPVGKKLKAQIWGSQQLLNAQVREVAASADPVTRTFAVKLTLLGDKPPALGTTLAVFVKDVPATAALAAIQLPTSALRLEGGQSTIWVLDPASMTVKPQVVTLGPAQGNELVVTAGLQTGWEVVATGVHVLTPGQKVVRYTTPQSAAIGSASTSTTAQPVAK